MVFSEFSVLLTSSLVSLFSHQFSDLSDDNLLSFVSSLPLCLAHRTPICGKRRREYAICSTERKHTDMHHIHTQSAFLHRSLSLLCFLSIRHFFLHFFISLFHSPLHCPSLPSYRITEDNFVANGVGEWVILYNDDTQTCTYYMSGQGTGGGGDTGLQPSSTATQQAVFTKLALVLTCYQCSPTTPITLKTLPDSPTTWTADVSNIMPGTWFYFIDVDSECRIGRNGIVVSPYSDLDPFVFPSQVGATVYCSVLPMYCFHASIADSACHITIQSRIVYSVVPFLLGPWVVGLLSNTVISNSMWCDVTICLFVCLSQVCVHLSFPRSHHFRHSAISFWV